MAEHEVQVHEVEYLSVSNAKINGEPFVIITIRPDEGSFRPHNIDIDRCQAKRLLEDLKTLLSRSTVFLMLLALAEFSGCSGKVEHETISSRPDAAEAASFTRERSRTAVAVDLFKDQGPVVLEDGKPVEVPFDGTVVVDGCIHFHEHLHVYLDEGDRRAERIAVEVVREWANGDCGRDRRE